ncbi:MAG: universal stress protein [Nitrospirota bacterium]|jgi:nucleotide-binding universal stress UspA family protein
MEYKSILCPIDGSELSEKVEDAGVYLSKISGAKLILLNVVEKWYRSAHLVTDSTEWQNIHTNWLNEGRGILEKEAAKLKEKGVKDVEMVLRDGDAAHEIIALAMEQRADLIIMATHRYSPVGKFFMGSVTDKVTKSSPCPVLWVFK